MKIILFFLLFICLGRGFAQKAVSSVLNLESFSFTESTLQSLTLKYTIKNNGPEKYIFHGSTTTPIDDLTVTIYLSKNETLETGVLGGENDLQIGTFVPAQYTLLAGSTVTLKKALSLNRPPFGSYKYCIVSVAYVQGPGMSSKTYLSKKYSTTSAGLTLAD